MSVDTSAFADPMRCRVLLVEFLSRQTPDRWMPLAEVRDGMRWPNEPTSRFEVPPRELISVVKAAAKDGLIEFKSGEFYGRASVRLKVTTPPASPAKEHT